MSLDKVEYQGRESNEKFFIFVDSSAINEWKKDKSVPLSRVLETFDVFIDRGVKGEPERPSDEELQAVFGTTNEEDVCRYILNNGILKSTNARVDEDKLNTIYPESPRSVSGFEAANIPNVKHHYSR